MNAVPEVERVTGLDGHRRLEEAGVSACGKLFGDAVAGIEVGIAADAAVQLAFKNLFSTRLYRTLPFKNTDQSLLILVLKFPVHSVHILCPRCRWWWR